MHVQYTLEVRFTPETDDRDAIKKQMVEAGKALVKSGRDVVLYSDAFFEKNEDFTKELHEKGTKI
jgi:hypothetical protein